MEIYIKIFLTIASAIIYPQLTTTQNTEYANIKQLRDDVLVRDKYDRLSRPVKNHNTVTVVRAMMAVIRFISLDYKKGILTTFASLQLNWTDENLVWNPANYGGLNDVIFGVDEIWKPDICNTNAYTMVRTDQNLGRHDLRVNSSGHVQWITLGYFQSLCVTNVNDYPYDEHYCDVTLESWIYSNNQLNFTTFEGIDFWRWGPLFMNPEWKLAGKRSGGFSYVWNKSNYSALYIEATLRRRFDFYYNLVQVPYYLSVAISLVMFALPPNSKKRYQLGFVIVAMMTMLVLFIAAQLQGAAMRDTPTSLKNISVTLLTVSVALALSTAIARLVVKWSEILPQQPLYVSMVSGQAIVKIIGSGYFPAEPFEEAYKSDFADRGQSRAEGKAEPTPTQREWITFAIIADRLLFLSYLIVILVRHA